LRLPAELRLEIYRLLLAGRTVHIEEIDERPKKLFRLKPCKLSYSICTANGAMQSLSHLTGAKHSQDASSATIRGTEKPCLNDFEPHKNGCRGPIRLDVQLLRICRRVYDEAALLPYAENYFIISNAGHTGFLKAFATQFSLEKRGAMHTVAVLRNWEAEIELVPKLLPGLKRLWFEAVKEAFDSKQSLAKRQSKRVKAFSRIKCQNLIGVSVNYAWTFPDGEDEGMEERLELALLSKRSL